MVVDNSVSDDNCAWARSSLVQFSSMSIPSSPNSDDLEDFPGRLLHQVCTSLTAVGCNKAYGIILVIPSLAFRFCSGGTLG